MRVVVTGKDGQVARALAQAARGAGVEVVRLGRPELDLARLETIAPALRAARPDVVVSAAAYTAVDRAESEPQIARLVNGEAPGVLAEVARSLRVPIVHLSTDYVFDGVKPDPYIEDDPVGPKTVYGETKLMGERAVAAAGERYAVLRTAWVYAPWGANFVRTMLRLAESRDEIGVVSDQHGCPTYAPDIALAVLAVAGAEGRAGVYHMAAMGEASWAGFAEAVFDGARARGAPSARVKPIATSEYPTPARRPANSRLDCTRLREVFGVSLPHWRGGLERCLDALVGATGGASV